MGTSISSLVFPAPNCSYDKSWDHFIEIPLKQSPLSSSLSSPPTIGAFFFEYPSSQKVLLYSHGNGEDIGQLWGYMNSLSKILKVNVLIYDYIGYGINSSKPSEQGCIDAIRGCWEYLLYVKGFLPNSIVCYGRSIGTGPTVHLVSQLCDKGVLPRAMVLEAPYTSVFDVVSDLVGHSSAACDLFKSKNKITSVTIPVVLFHGTIDNVIPFKHSLALDEICKKHQVSCELVELKGGSHNDLYSKFGDKMWGIVMKLFQTS